MTHRPGSRVTLGPLRVTKVTMYPRKIRGDQEIEVWRYAFVDPRGNKFVYSGTYQRLKVPDDVYLIATIKAEIDQYGFTRLARIKKTDKPQPELDL